MVNSNNLIPQVKAYQTGLHISPEQNDILQRWMSGYHYAYNLFLSSQFGLIDAYHRLYPDYRQRKKLPKAIKKQFFLSAYEFEKIYNHNIKPSKYMNLSWIKDMPAHSFRYGFRTAADAFHNYFIGTGGKPHFKGYKATRSIYFDGSIIIFKNKVKLPKIGWLQLERINYLPTTHKVMQQGSKITAAYIHEKANHWFISIRTNEQQNRDYLNLHANLVLGIDLGIKDFAILSNGKTYVNITKGKYYRHLENYKKRIQRKLSRQEIKTKPGQRRVTTMNYRKTQLRFRRWCRKISCYMKNWIEQRTSEIVQLRPTAITLEKLNIQGMKSNHHLAPALQKIPLYLFKQTLIWKCKKAGIEVREADRWYPSTKTCSRCHQYNHKQFHGVFNDLQIRTFNCPYCGLEIDRDLNAAINLKNRNHYEIITNKAMDFNPNVVTTI